MSNRHYIMSSNRPRYILIALLLVLLINYPLLSVANKADKILGLPMLYAYLGVVWILITALLFVTSKSKSQKRTDE